MGSDYPADFIEDAVSWDVNLQSGVKYHYQIDRRNLRFIALTTNNDAAKSYKLEVGICQIDHRAF